MSETLGNCRDAPREEMPQDLELHPCVRLRYANRTYRVGTDDVVT
jgi:hypothetical protein